MNRYLCLIPLLVLLYDFVWWFEFASKSGAVPEFKMLIVHVMGVFVLACLIFKKSPNSVLGGLGIIWGLIYVTYSVLNFQQFGFASFLTTWLLPILLFGLVISPVIFRSYVAIKNV